jgi:hypothetical protein
MDYEIVCTQLKELVDMIDECNKDNILNKNIIYNVIKHVHKDIPDNIKKLLIDNSKYALSCVKTIYKRVERYSDKSSYVDILVKLKNKLSDFADDDELKDTYKMILEFMITKNIIKNIVKSNTYVCEIFIPSTPSSEESEISSLSE